MGVVEQSTVRVILIRTIKILALIRVVILVFKIISLRLLPAKNVTVLEYELEPLRPACPRPHPSDVTSHKHVSIAAAAARAPIMHMYIHET